MPLESGVVTGHDALATIANPWEESSFSSAVRSKETRPTVRRRVSDGAARRSRNDHEPHRVAHSRVRTLDGDVTRPTSSHPLASPSSSRAVKDFVTGLLSAHDTRPHMKRVLSDTEAPSNSGNGSSDAIDDQAIEPKTREEEVVVILHEVTSNDSLPGVALKYGVSLPDLRRWNQLWPSDPVHLRKVLYIPLDKARHVKHFHTTLIEVDGGADAPSPASLLVENIVGTANHNVVDQDDPREPPLTVVRIPVSQMSFFPPPSTPLSSRSISEVAEAPTISQYSGSQPQRPTLPPFVDSPTGSTAFPSPSSAPHTSLGFSFGGRPQGRSLGALFATARSTLTERLSLDSSGTTSTQSDDHDWGHELEDVRVASLGEGRPHEDDLHGRYETFTRDRGRRILLDSVAKHEALELDPLLTRASVSGALGRSSEDLKMRPSALVGAAGAHDKATRYDIPDHILASPSVRTAQPEPSPVMQLPPIRWKSRPSGG